MAYDYRKAFALKDNPFSPLQPLDGLLDVTAQNDLANNPLLINLEPVLETMFSPDAGAFGTFMGNFQSFARMKGYREKPPGTGLSSFAFSIYGNEGTGKTSMAQYLISWLKQCKPKTGEWHIFDEWSLERMADPLKQIERINEVQSKIEKEISRGSYCCVVVDNLVPGGALDRAIEMFDQLTAGRKKWIVFLFLLSNVNELFNELSGAGKRQITPFRMLPLSADWAVSFVKHRIDAFRDSDVKVPWLAKYPLFPFSEKDISGAFASNKVLGLVSGDSISLKQFAVILDRMISSRLQTLPADFDISEVAEKDVKTHLLPLSREYERLVA
ncbi:MAG: hypothetical protein H7Z16_03310 [Pyrinomonadaceae bacterium]|nr:hypothetical protein [Pyrinomonadaceae bacterium]